MSKRKDHLKALFGGAPVPGDEAAPSPMAKPAPAPETKAVPRSAASETSRTASGAVKAMGLSLSSMSREVEDARALKDALAKGERVVEIDPNLIDPSLVRDRLSREDDGDEEFSALVESVRENGQQVPVLLRPHPTANGRYQVAYGHRRVRAAARLARPVQAIVRALDDNQLVLAQGKENTERRNLSFIERAFFAAALIRHGFERGVVQRALSLHKAEMTRFLQVADAVPAQIAGAIGPAPKAGRPRWMLLADFLQDDAAIVIAQDVIHSDAFRAASSDERFGMLFERLAKREERKAGVKGKASKPTLVADRKGRPLAHVISGKKPRMEFDEKVRPGFADYVAALLPELAERFEKERG
ncbi:plasmid partitioning protein RepB [Nitratireductor indicus]|uniref:plasmid partitioning protein RepB n=1 Tax=Nitratireductor indicus TaxID=721133 RepID=UPI002874191E|nr:plasmid partitioning protein RepB [Nitratireductor indicus]MDS1137816.1 plasmid partitioning protein RepB [Nitratireductor indicus]